MYRILQEEGIDLPRYVVLNRDPDKPEGGCGVTGSVLGAFSVSSVTEAAVF